MEPGSRTVKKQDASDNQASVSCLTELERKVLWLASWTIHNANHLRESEDGLKVGGHQASSASLVTVMTALYFAVLRPEDRVAVKPHASPAFHAIQYLLGNQSLDKLQRFRGFKGAHTKQPMSGSSPHPQPAAHGVGPWWLDAKARAMMVAESLKRQAQTFDRVGREGARVQSGTCRVDASS